MIAWHTHTRPLLESTQVYQLFCAALTMLRPLLRGIYPCAPRMLVYLTQS